MTTNCKMIPILLLAAVSLTSGLSRVKEISSLSLEPVWRQQRTIEPVKKLQENQKLAPLSHEQLPARSVDNYNDGTTNKRITDEYFLEEGFTGFKDGYTSIDLHHKEKGKGIRRGVSKAAGSPGAHHPKDLSYADKDLFSLTGGSFQGTSFYDLQRKDDEKEVFRAPKPFPWKLRSPQSLQTAYTSNTPLVVVPPTHFNWERAYPAATYFPAFSFFFPAQMSERVTYAYHPILLQSLPNTYTPELPYNKPTNLKRNHLAALKTSPKVIKPLLYVQPYQLVPYSLPKSWFSKVPLKNKIPGPGHPLHGDTNVNYKHPLPPTNDDAEVIKPLHYHRSASDAHPELNEYRPPSNILRTGKPNL